MSSTHFQWTRLKDLLCVSYFRWVIKETKTATTWIYCFGLKSITSHISQHRALNVASVHPAAHNGHDRLYLDQRVKKVRKKSKKKIISLTSLRERKSDSKKKKEIEQKKTKWTQKTRYRSPVTPSTTALRCSKFIFIN